MTREEALTSIAERYSAEPEYPWGDENCIFRHESNRKWFAIVMRVPYARLGIDREGLADVMNTDGTAEDGLIRELLEISWELTKPRRKVNR